MSFSEPKIQNPATKFIDFKDGQFQYFDKETEKNVIIDLPIYFIVLDELSTISGFCEKHNCGIYSNEVQRISDEVLKVKTFKGGESITGLYKDISDEVKVLGGKFTKSVYALLINEDQSTEFVNFKFRGAAFSGWLDKKFNPEKSAVGIMETYEATKGKTVYQVPVFKPFKLTPELTAQAIDADKSLQTYLKSYKAQQVEKELAKTEDPEPEPIKANDQWLGGKSAKQIIAEKKQAATVDESDDLPFKQGFTVILRK
jgi:hypothetical protein